MDNNYTENLIKEFGNEKVNEVIEAAGDTEIKGEFFVPVQKMLACGADKDWFETAFRFASQPDSCLVLNDIAEICVKGISLDEFKQRISEKDVKQVCDELLFDTESGLSDIVAQSDNFRDRNVEFIMDYMEEKVNKDKKDYSNTAENLISLSMNIKDIIFGLQYNQASLEKNITAQKKLLEIQREHISKQDNVICSQKDTIEKYEKKFAYLEKQYEKLKRSMSELNSFQTGIESFDMESE